jgi:lipopolysaccharide export system protein LptC
LIISLLRANSGLYVLFLAAVATSSFLLFTHSGEEESAHQPQAGTVDYFAVNLERLALKEDGVIKERLFTAHLDHLAEEDETLLERPLMTFYDRNPSASAPWKIYGDKGRLSRDGMVHLEDTVLINRDALNEGGRSIRIITSQVDINPTQSMASTRDHIEMISPPDEMSADGANIHYASPITIHLLSNVRRIHHVE